MREAAYARGTVEECGSQSDEILLAALARGDSDALTVLYARYRDFVHHTASTILGDPGAAEDVAQDVFLKIWHAARFDPVRGTPRSWIFAITRHRAVSHLRSVSSRARRYPSLDTLGRTAVCPDGWEALDRALQQEELHASLAVLPPNQRRTVERVYLDGQTQRAVAATDGIPLGTVKGRTRRGLQQLRRLLNDPPDSPSSAWAEHDCPQDTDADTSSATRRAVSMAEPPPVHLITVLEATLHPRIDMARIPTDEERERPDALPSNEREELQRLRDEVSGLRQEYERFRNAAALASQNRACAVCRIRAEYPTKADSGSQSIPTVQSAGG